MSNSKHKKNKNLENNLVEWIYDNTPLKSLDEINKLINDFCTMSGFKYPRNSTRITPTRIKSWKNRWVASKWAIFYFYVNTRFKQQATAENSVSSPADSLVNNLISA